MTPIITLTTDFGLSDPYAGQVEGAILSLLPEARVVGLTHLIAPGAVSEAAFVLEISARHFPAGSVHVVVVDPGVGSDRRRLVVRSGDYLYVGPDNGCLSAAVPDEQRGLRAAAEGYLARLVDVPAELEAYSIERLELLPGAPSATFEGRDLFAPVAAMLAAGGPVEDFGPRVTEMLAFPAFRGPAAAGAIDGMVMRVDHFGNLVTDLRGADIPSQAVLSIGGLALPFVRTYADAPGLAAIEGSSGYIELALPNGSAAAALGAGVGAEVVVRRG